ncbi:13841_t:CDS:2, partial [Racocetra persica]
RPHFNIEYDETLARLGIVEIDVRVKLLELGIVETMAGYVRVSTDGDSFHLHK